MKSFTSNYFSKLKNKMFYFELLTRLVNFKSENNFYLELLIPKIKKQNLDFEVAQNFCTEMRYYTIQNYLEKMRLVGFCAFRYRSCSQ